MKRKRIILMLGALVLAATMIGYAVAQERHAPPPPAGTDPAGEVHKRLRQKLPKLEFTGIAFKDVVQFLREVSNTNISVKRKVLKAAGVKMDTPITIELRDVTFGKAIRVILDDAGGATPLDFVVDDNVITISTREDIIKGKAMAAEVAFPRKQAEHMDVMIGLVHRMKQVCFDPEAVGVMAVGALKDDVRRKDEAIVKDLEEQLAKVKTQGLRNAFRLSLKDIYKRQGENEKVIEHIKALIAENDEALQPKPNK